MDDLLLTPYAPNLIESTRSIGYSFETALADIIDNSISNFASRVDVKFRGGSSAYVAVVDDGVGMQQEKLEHAMRYGSNSSLEERESTDLGRFGLGLKMASLSQCRCLTVISKFNGKIAAATWDIDYISEKKNWLLKRYSEEEIYNLKFYKELSDRKSGTAVIWEKFDRISESEADFDKVFDEKLNFADKHLSLVFHRYLENPLSNQYFELFFNNRKLEPIDPYVLSNKATQKLEEEILFIDKKMIRITPYITPYANKLSTKERQLLNSYDDLRLKQGLYIYRNKRLIVWGKWFRLLRDDELKRLAKIQIDLPNSIDNLWSIDVKKSSAQIPSIIREPLKQIVIRAVGKSEMVYKYRGRNVKLDNYEHIWNKVINRDKMQYMINRDIPLFAALEKSLDEDQYRMFDNLIKTVEAAFPYSAVYYDLAKDEKFEELNLNEEAIYQSIKDSLNVYKGDRKAQFAMLETMQNLDIYQKNSKVLDLVREELKNGK